MTAEEPLTVVTSFAQQSLWLQQQADPEQTAYNITATLALRGPLDADALERALNRVVERHEVLRTVFALHAQDPVQIVLPDRPLRVPVLDSAPDDIAAEARKVLHTPFDLAEGPLLRLTLLRLAPGEHVALLAVHHIVTDGASSAVLLRELTLAYAAERAGVEPIWDELPIQYADFAVWQRERLSGPLRTELAAHWTAALAGAGPLRLPDSTPQGAGRERDSVAHPFHLPTELTTALETLARDRGATLFMVLLAALDALLSRYCRQDDITVVSPVSGRLLPELEELIGYFVNPLLLRTDVSGDPSFTGLLDRVRESTLTAFDHQELPLEQATELLRRHGRPGAEELGRQAMLVLQSPRPASWRVDGLDFELLPTDTTGARAELVLDVRPDPAGGASAVLEHRTGLLPAGAGRRMAGHFVALLAAAVADPGAKLSRLLETAVPQGELPATAASAEVTGAPAAVPAPGEGAADGGVPQETPYVAPRTPLEEEIAQLWSELLDGEEPVGVLDNFFDLGGQSLVAVRLAARLRDEFGVELTVRDLYADFTVAGVAWTVLQRLAAAEEVQS